MRIRSLTFSPLLNPQYPELCRVQGRHTISSMAECTVRWQQPIVTEIDTHLALFLVPINKGHYKQQASHYSIKLPVCQKDHKRTVQNTSVALGILNLFELL